MKWFLLNAAALGMLAFSQSSPDNSRNEAGWPGDLVLPRPGIPLSLAAVETETVAGVERETLIRKIYRDRDGRTRVEPYHARSANLVKLLDPVKGMLLILESTSQTAHRMWFPKMESPGGAMFTFSAGSSTQTEKLGMRIIDGIRCEGLRITISRGTLPESEIEERWFSNELGLISLTTEAAAGRYRVARIQKLVLEEPNPALFQVPEQYTFHDLNSPE